MVAHVDGRSQCFPPGDVAVFEPYPFQIVGEKEIPGQPLVLGDLVSLQNGVQVFADFLVFEIAHNRFIQLDFEIRCAQPGLVLLGS